LSGEAFTIAAFACGNYLHGQVPGISHAEVAFGIAIFVTGEFPQRAEAKEHRMLCIAATVLVSLPLAFPRFISSDIKTALSNTRLIVLHGLN